MSEENVDKIRRGQEGFSRGDLAPIKDAVADDVEWGAVGAFPGVEEIYRGPGAMDRWMEAIRSAWEAFEASTDEVIRDTGDVVVLAERLRGRGRESGVEVEMLIFSTFWFREGKIVKRRAFTSRQEAIEAAGLSE